MNYDLRDRLNMRHFSKPYDIIIKNKTISNSGKSKKKKSVTIYNR